MGTQLKIGMDERKDYIYVIVYEAFGVIINIHVSCPDIETAKKELEIIKDIHYPTMIRENDYTFSSKSQRGKQGKVQLKIKSVKLI